MKNKEMNIDDLARMIKKSFDHVDDRFDRVERDMDDLKRGQKEIKQDMIFTARKFEMKELESRVEKLEYKFAKMAK
ncbi:MAG: hypothetical protein A2288_00980 [Candidatus Moranbacteria bacterium RIFOXYA12_FULL_44_15]|nr:MAG: hypothetical protein A2288_00980 [Candidatus Moranbacteria bacterium RIFOXYA12_FULL_44_15]OGI36450.1 MAG: hypothetical protein A2259_00875 [Candidatus Moranbacteria bacterium RIFOXYA2_FULL_43_15]